MTGKYPARLHLTDFIAGGDFPRERLRQPDWQKFLPLEEFTLAELFQSQGYVTASFGKWHLSSDKLPPRSAPYDPDKQGFDETFITEKPSSRQDPESDAHRVEAITERALQFLDKRQDKPFFLYVTYNSIHAPIMSKAKLVEKHKSKPGADRPENNPIIAAMMEEMDAGIGRILRKLEEWKLADHTLVVFFSDNGGLEADAKQTPLRSGKANLYEGGIRVPFLVRWPGVVQPGTTCREPVISMDFFPTFREILGVTNAPQGTIDGVSLLPLLRQTGSLTRPALYWHYPHYHGSSVGPGGAVRAGDYKLIEWYDESIRGAGKSLELYNLKEDIGGRIWPNRGRQVEQMRGCSTCGGGSARRCPQSDDQRAKRSKPYQIRLSLWAPAQSGHRSESRSRSRADSGSRHQMLHCTSLRSA
jgi:uncharacterized sulfatase